VRPGRLRSPVQTAAYLISESDRLVTEILDALEVVSAERGNSDCNHLFISFLPAFVLEPEQVTEALRGFIDRHGQRLWRLRVTGAEIRFNALTSRQSEPLPIRFSVTNVSGFILRMETYVEVEDPKSGPGVWVFKSL
ncbi:acetyl-CoA carboxylase, partial [Piptocephalis cylindrospora]